MWQQGEKRNHMSFFSLCKNVTCENFDRGSFSRHHWGRNEICICIHLHLVPGSDPGPPHSSVCWSSAGPGGAGSQSSLQMCALKTS